ncbi:Monomeric sarcosine oxidase [Streptomyces sp. ADI96-02]|uniref:FAD-dependent oxidoreductase n=1 Tax=unclassified Streptomyces TaxID=2593676 RepID=UPI000F54F7FF|nr:FAD-dependent oxidoreductase [Streptomyces sp. ADI96-02]RPK69201.1 Monomeric sarcosine oxidase [Streptomyces sp. ADI96-02]
MATRAELVVIGGGLMGAATAWAASRRGLSVLLLEQFPPGHTRGSSHGSSRIVRRGYEDALYTRLTGRSFELWRELELDSGASLLRMLGSIDFGTRPYAESVAAQLAAAGVAHEVLGADEAERRWPGMRFEGPVVHHGQGGTVDAAAAVAAFTDTAVRRGAVVRHGSAVASLEAAGDGARVELADGGTVLADRVVVAAGGWTGELLAGHVELPPLTVTQQDTFHFPRLDPTAAAWPSVLHEQGAGVYHLAGGRDGGPADDRKIGEHYTGRSTTAGGRDGVVTAESRARAVEYVKRWLPGLDPVPRSETSCLFTFTPSEDFLLDRVGPFVVCSPCSGHGAKFAPLIGELTVGLVTGDATVPEPFRLAAHLSRTSGTN